MKLFQFKKFNVCSSVWKMFDVNNLMLNDTTYCEHAFSSFDLSTFSKNALSGAKVYILNHSSVWFHNSLKKIGWSSSYSKEFTVKKVFESLNFMFQLNWWSPSWCIFGPNVILRVLTFILRNYNECFALLSWRFSTPEGVFLGWII